MLTWDVETFNMTEQQPKNLFEQTKNLVFLGERLSGEPEILHEIQDWANAPVARVQIRRILEYVPIPFPEDWKSPDGFDELSPDQLKAFMDILSGGAVQLVGQDLETIIKLGVFYRDKYL